MKPIRVLVVEDSPTVRARLIEVLAGDRQFEVVGEAGDGRQAIELCQKLQPDVITLDMMLPVMTGVAVTEYIMAHLPTPILIVSASTNRGELYRTYDALAAGAVDVLEKPRGDEPDGTWEAGFRSAVRLVSRIKVITHPRARLAQAVRPARPPGVPVQPVGIQLIAIGASTGGPGAMVEILQALPSGFALPILLVLHIGEPFGTGFADWLDGQSTHRVHFAREGEPIGHRPGIVMAPPDRHMLVQDGRVRLSRDAERHSCRPSVDVLFESVARETGAGAAAFLLTGMGRDGAQGLLEIRQAGGFTVAQDEATSVVYGMPREAALMDAAERILPLREMAPMIASLAVPTPRKYPK